MPRKSSAAGAVRMQLLLAVISGLLFAGCGKSGGSTFTIALSEDIRSLDPGMAWNFTDNQVTNQIGEGLLTFDENGQLAPLLARSWSQPDPLTYVYEVRDDIVFSDGSKMTMDDVVFSFQRARGFEGGEPAFADFFSDVDYIYSEGWKLIITFKSPDYLFKYVPALSGARIISRDYYFKTGPGKFGTAEGGIIATGPFVYKSWSEDGEVVLEKNKNYWNKAAGKANIIGTLVFKVIRDDTERVAALKGGSVDFSALIPENSMELFLNDKNVDISVIDTFSTEALAMNTQRAPMNDKLVRKAISHALDLASFKREVLKSAASAEGTALLFPPALAGENAADWEDYVKTAPKYDFDLDRARDLMRRSVYPAGFSARLVCSETDFDGYRALLVKESLKPLGIDVEIIEVPGNVATSYALGAIVTNSMRDYEMLLLAWEADYPDVDSTLWALLNSANADYGYNAAAYMNPEVDALMAEQDRSPGPAERFEIRKKIMDIVIEDAPYVTIDYTKREYALNAKYTMPPLNAEWNWNFSVKDVRKK